MSNLMRASRELFSRTPDETFDSLDQLSHFCSKLKERSADKWQPPESVIPTLLEGGELGLTIGSAGQFHLNDWSFGQLCGLAHVDKSTINRLNPETAMQAFTETLPRGRKPLQILTTDDRVRSVHGVSYTRLDNLEVLGMVREHASDFEPPKKGINGATGLYAGEQDMFCFLIDPNGWVDIGGESFAPGFFVWNSEVGRRTVGIETFWFQSICANHIVWDAMEVTSFTRKHTANVHKALPEMAAMLDQLVKSRDQRRDAFAERMKAAQSIVVGDDAEATMKALSGHGIPQTFVRDAIKMITEKGSRFSVFAIVDALTRISGRILHAGDRAESDAKIGRLLALAV